MVLLGVIGLLFLAIVLGGGTVLVRRYRRITAQVRVGSAAREAALLASVGIGSGPDTDFSLTGPLQHVRADEPTVSVVEEPGHSTEPVTNPALSRAVTDLAGALRRAAEDVEQAAQKTPGSDRDRAAAVVGVALKRVGTLPLAAVTSSVH